MIPWGLLMGSRSTAEATYGTRPLPGNARSAVGLVKAVLLLSLFFLRVPCAGDAALDLLTSGKKAFADGLYTIAVKDFQRILDEFPESARAEEADYLLGVSLFYAGKWTDALAALGAFRSRRPKSAFFPRTGYWLGASNLKLGKYETALGYLRDQARATADANPYRSHAMLLSGVALEGLGKDAEAAQFYRSLIAEKASSSILAESVFRLAGIEYRAGNYVLARDLYAKIPVDHAKSAFVPDALFFLAECELALGSLPDAEKRYATLLSLYPDSPWREAATFRLADIAMKLGKPDEALRQLDILEKQYPEGSYRGNAMLLRADILFSRKKFEEAQAMYAAALRRLKDGAQRQSALYSMGLAAIQRGANEEAVDFFTRAKEEGIRGVPLERGTLEVSARASFQLIALLAGAGKNDQAIGALDEYLRRYPESANGEDALRLLASLLEKKGDHAAALARWDALVKKYPKSPLLAEHLYRRGSALLRLDRATAALDDFQKVVKEFPGSQWRDESSYSVGFIYSQRGEYARAVPFFQSVLENVPKGELAERSRFAIGICWFNTGSFEKAFSSFQELEKKKPKSVQEGQLVLLTGRTLYRMERMEEAAQRLKEAVELLENDFASRSNGTYGISSSTSPAEALYWLGWSYFRLGRLVDARDAFLAIADRYPTDPRKAETLFRAGICETLRSEDAAAVSYFDKALAVSSSQGDAGIREQALYERGWALSRLGRKAESEESFESLAKEFPNGGLAPDAFFKAATMAFEQKRYEDAAKGFNRVVKDFPKSELAGQARYWAAEAVWESGDARAAADAFWGSITLESRGSLLQASMEGFGKALAKAGSIELARSYAQKARETRGLSAEAVSRVLLFYAEMLLDKEPAGALAVLGEVKKRAPPEPVAGEASLLMGRYYSSVGDRERAIGIFSALADSRVDRIGALAKREQARTLEAAGSTAEALEEYLRISYLFPDFPDLASEGLYDAARVALLRGEKERAGKITDGLKKSFPDSPWIGKLTTFR